MVSHKKGGKNFSGLKFGGAGESEKYLWYRTKKGAKILVG